MRFVEKRMMGGLCYMVSDKMCLGISGDRLMVRLDPDLYEESLKMPGCRAMDITGKPLRGFVFVQPEEHDSNRQLEYWIELALQYNPRAQSSKKRKTKSNATSRSPKSTKPVRKRTKRK